MGKGRQAGKRAVPPAANPPQAPPPGAPPGSGRRRVWLGGLLALAGLALGLVLWSRRPPADEGAARARLLERRPAPSELNVLFVTLDTLRADRLGCYGFTGVETPNLDALASEGVLFEQATSTVPITLPAHTSIFTGLVPPHHGVRDNGGFVLDEASTTLAERMKAGGWATGAFVAAWVLDSRWGLDQGFDHYDDRFDLSKFKVVSLGTVQKPGDEVADEALAWLETVRDRKFFAWVHLYDPHTPYEPPEPFASRYPRQPYLGEIAYTDKVVGRLFDWLRQKGLWEKTLVVVTGDHGESLGEHGEQAHTFFIYDSTTHVPLIIRTPWGDRGRAAAQVSHVDLMPTVLDLVGLPPEPKLDGRSVARLLLDPSADPGHVAYSETYFPRYHFGWQHLRSLRDGRHKFVEAPTPELYDLAQDRGEEKNVYKAYSKRGEELRQALERLAGTGRESAPERQSLDPETLQRLAALGYVGNVPDVPADAVLPDPKDKIETFNRMSRAKGLARDEKYAEAVSAMRAVLAEDPHIIDSYVLMGGWLQKLGKDDEALQAYRKALEVKPDNDSALGEMATLYRKLGQPEAALEGYRTALKLDARKPGTWYQLATLYLDLGREQEAERTFRQALEHNPKMGAAYNSLGALAFQRGQMAQAEELVRKGLELEPDVRGGRYNLARVLEARGEAAEAERLYREELGTYADHGRARFNLAQLLRERGDQQGYLAELKNGVEKAPDFGGCFFFLAREELRAGRLDAAADLSERGLRAENLSELAPLGHYVLADVYNRRGEPAKAQAEVAAARRLESHARRRPGGAL